MFLKILLYQPDQMFLIHSQIFYNCKVHQGRNLHYL